MPQTVEEIKLYKITGVEVFAAGTWNGKKHGIDALHSMVTAFNALNPGWVPPLKLGHDNDQAFANASGLPAIGYVSNLYVRGDKLYADFDHMPEAIFKAIRGKSYRKVSCEVYYNIELHTGKYSHVLGAIALLGSELPGVTNLADILSLYSGPQPTEVFANAQKEGNLVTYSQTFEYEHTEDESMPTAEELSAQLEIEKANFAKSQEDLTAKDAELATLRKFKEDAEAEKVKLALEAQVAQKKAFMTELEAAKLITPATKLLIEELLSDKAEFSVKIGEEEKQFSKESALKEILSLTVEAAKVNFDESSAAEFKKKDGEEGMDEEIRKYQMENKCSYDKAYRAVVKGKEK